MSTINGVEEGVLEMRKLRESIVDFNKNSSKWSNRLFLLTIALGVLAILQIIFMVLR